MRLGTLMLQWLRVHLPKQGAWIWLLVWGDPPCGGVTGGRDCWLPSLGPDLQQETPLAWEAHMRCRESSRYWLCLEQVCAAGGPRAAPKEECLSLFPAGPWRPVRGRHRLAGPCWERCGRKSSDFRRDAGSVGYALNWRRVELRQGVKIEYGQLNWRWASTQHNATLPARITLFCVISCWLTWF